MRPAMNRPCRILLLGSALLTLAVTEVRGQNPTLLSTAALAPLAGSDSVTIVDVRAAWTSYLENHIPGAVWLSIETLRATEGRLPFQLLSGPAYAALFQRLGVEAGRPVVIYSAGDALDIDATFVAWLLRGLGHPRVSVLDGGFAKWQIEGRPVTQRYPSKRTPAPAPVLHGESFAPEQVSLAEVRTSLGRQGVVLVDARPTEQYEGRAGAQLRRGHIPGAVSHPWKSDLETRDLVLVWKPVETLRSEYAAQGITPDREVILYCNSGSEASHLLFALKYLLGYPRVRIYTGSWTEWAENESLPIAR